jgi:Tol biopolymer transport system component
MDDLKTVLERSRDQIGSSRLTPEDVSRRRGHKERNRRIRAGAVGVIVAVAAGIFLARSMSQAVPADQPTPTPSLPPASPAAAGTLAYIVDGDVFVVDPDGSHVVKIADGRSAECNGIGDGGEYWSEGQMWSPDGRYLAYRYADCFASDEEARAEGLPEGVVISDAKGNVLTSFPTGRGWDIGWSPDSTRVAVWDEFSKTIGIYGLDGARQIQITRPFDLDSDSDPFWMPDGTALAVGDWVIPLDGGGREKLPENWEPYGDGNGISPDGSRIATINDGSLTVARSDGSDAREVPGEWLGKPAWSPKGDLIAVVSAVSGGGRELHVVDVATGSETLVTHARPGMELEVVGFTPKGDRILFTTGDRSLFTTEEWAVAWSLRSIGVDGSSAHLIVDGTNGNFSRAS